MSQYDNDNFIMVLATGIPLLICIAICRICRFRIKNCGKRNNSVPQLTNPPSEITVVTQPLGLTGPIATTAPTAPIVFNTPAQQLYYPPYPSAPPTYIPYPQAYPQAYLQQIPYSV
jgi:hypothetical protein